MKAWWQRSGGLAVSGLSYDGGSWGLAFVGTTAQVMSQEALLRFYRSLGNYAISLTPGSRSSSASTSRRILVGI